FTQLLLLHLLISYIFSLTLLPPPRSTLFPYTTLFRSFFVSSRVAKAIGSHGASPTTRPNRTITRHGQKQVYSGRRFLAPGGGQRDRKSTRLNSSHGSISYAVFCLKKKK